MRNCFLVLALSFFIFSCSNNRDKLFTKLSADKTGVDFANVLQEGDPQFNILSYPYFYNGGGVAVGDINNDGLPDIVFTGNMVRNRLYVNEGKLKFKDITDQSHIANAGGWCTGVTMADVNNDGWLDIYICRSGQPSSTFRKNLLYINNHDLTFTESAAKYGLNDAGYSTQASFFDYDKDGDLDVMLINQSNPKYSKGRTEYVGVHEQAADSLFANKLLRNDGGHFTDVSKQAGITSNVLSFSLGISTADINDDGWPDIYISNDFKEPDYLYINNHDGTFTNSLTQKISHTSLYGMGVDIADYNNDDYPDIVQMDMLPEGNSAQKMHLGADNYDKFQYLFVNGMPYQYMKNSLQKNNGDGSFSEIGELTGISNTDWSWSVFFADFDNDGLKDLFASNGYKRDDTNMQFLKYSMNVANQINQGKPLDVNDYIAHMPSILLPNYIFKNAGNDSFVNKIKDWGIDVNTLSNGAIYADLDNDGDLDLITNDVDTPAGIYENNNQSISKANYLRVQLQGNSKNKNGIGAKLYVYAKNAKQYYEQLSTRGYQSSVIEPLHIGLGDFTTVDSIRIIWPDDNTQLLTNVNVNQTIIVKQAEASSKFNYNKPAQPTIFTQDSVLLYKHTENEINDFSRQIPLLYSYSHNGPCMASADVNGDGLTDIYMGGSKGHKDHPGAIFLQDKNHNYHITVQPSITADATCDDAAASFFDANNDGKPDLYIVSGGYDDFNMNSPLLQDRLYINDGKGHFIKKQNALPQNFGSKSCVAPYDIDGDGDIDLFVGGKVQPGNWPQACKSSIYINDGSGNFSDETDKWNKQLSNTGIVTDAVWEDMDNDGIKDLVITGEWLAPTIFKNDHKSLVVSGLNKGLENETGLWNTIIAEDFDKDGKMDLCAGNFGLNSQLKATEKKTLELYVTDIDNNGTLDPILTYYNGDSTYPFIPMDDLISQVPSLRKKFYDYDAYENASVKEILPPDKFSSAEKKQVSNLQTTYFKNTGNGFVKQRLPVEVQYAPIYAIQLADINQDGFTDMILMGNNNAVRIRLGRQDANKGIVLMNDGKGNFSYLLPTATGLDISGDVRSSLIIDKHLLIGVNNQKVLSYIISK